MLSVRKGLPREKGETISSFHIMLLPSKKEGTQSSSLIRSVKPSSSATRDGSERAKSLYAWKLRPGNTQIVQRERVNLNPRLHVVYEQEAGWRKRHFEWTVTTGLAGLRRFWYDWKDRKKWIRTSGKPNKAVRSERCWCTPMNWNSILWYAIKRPR